jgi:hypothetical protein
VLKTKTAERFPFQPFDYLFSRSQPARYDRRNLVHRIYQHFFAGACLPFFMAGFAIGLPALHLHLPHLQAAQFALAHLASFLHAFWQHSFLSTFFCGAVLAFATAEILTVAIKKRALKMNFFIPFILRRLIIDFHRPKLDFFLFYDHKFLVIKL